MTLLRPVVRCGRVLEGGEVPNSDGPRGAQSEGDGRPLPDGDGRVEGSAPPPETGGRGEGGGEGGRGEWEG